MVLAMWDPREFNCPILRDWRGGLGRCAAHRTRALAHPRLSHFGAKMGQFVLHRSERRRVAAICAAALNEREAQGEAQGPQALVLPKGMPRVYSREPRVSS